MLFIGLLMKDEEEGVI